MSISRKVHMKISRSLRAGAAIAAVLVAVTTPAAYAVDFKGAGASAVNNFIAACKTSYQTATGDSFVYTGTGSGDGKKAMDNKTHDFAFSDSANTNATKLATQIHIPLVAWPVAVMTNLGSTRQLTLSTDTIAKIFAKKITRWNDPAIVADANKTYDVIVYKKVNGEVVKDKSGAPVVLRTQKVTRYFTLPNKPIVVIYRSGTSGTTNNFTKALNSLDSATWTNAGNDSFVTAFPGAVASDPVGLRAASGSAGVGQLAKDTRYSITYNEVSFAKSYNLQVVNVINPAGKEVAPATEGVLTAFAAATINESTGLVTFDYKSKLAGAYPFTATTYGMVLTGADKGANIASVKKMFEYHAFECPKLFPEQGMAVTTKDSELGKAIIKLLAKLN
jgi:phosphate transport system substrate-binding protein